MSGSAGGPEGLETRAEKLAERGDWEGLRQALSSHDPSHLALSPRLGYRYGEALYHTGRMRELADFATAFEEASRASSDLDGIMRALNLAGIAAFELGSIEGARVRWEELLDLADGVGDPDMMARAANNLGAVADLRGDGRAALAYYHLAVPSYQRLGRTRGLAQTYHNMGVSHRDLGEYEEARAAFARAISAAEAIPYPTVVVMALVSRAELECRRGDAALTVRLAERALELARELGDPINEGGALRVRGLGRLGSGDVSGGLDDLERALALARETENPHLEAESLRDLGRARLARGDAQGAGLLALAADRFAAMGAEAEARRIAEEAPPGSSAP